jgi:hypothetical protein
MYLPAHVESIVTFPLVPKVNIDFLLPCPYEAFWHVHQVDQIETVIVYP